VDYAIHSRSIDTRKFIAFLERLRGTFGDQPFCIFMDNLSVHKTKVVKETCEKLNIKAIYNVPYSPDFNGIECYFSLVKGAYKHVLLKCIVKGEPVD
jgi:transposase